jgi:branched-subunit amino acid aminotransferase/4-amino-4-deoxychorismate lyase
VLLLQARPLRPELETNAAEGTAVRRLPWPLRARGLPLQAHKTLAYLSSVMALSAVPAGSEPLLETTEGHVSEGAASNIYWAEGGRLFTPHTDAGCLAGVTRALVLRLAEQLEVPTEEGLYPVSHLARADEAFLTNSVVEIVPLTHLDGRPVGAGVPGSMTRRFQSAYREAVSRHCGKRT